MGTLLKLVPDLPVEIALSCADGINVVSPRGTPAVKYTLVDGRTFFATQYVAAKFKNMRVEANERIALCMRKIDGKHITMVERIPSGDAEREPAPESSSPPPNDPDITEGVMNPDLVNGLAPEDVNADHTPQISSAAPETVPPSDGYSTNGHSHYYGPELISELRAIAHEDESPLARPASQLERALKTSILAAHSAEQYGKEIGYPVRFDQESIKCMAVTVLIGMQGGRN